MAKQAAQESPELFMSNSCVQKLYAEMEAQADQATTVIYRDAKTFRPVAFGQFNTRVEAEAAVKKQQPNAQNLWFWASCHMG